VFAGGVPMLAAAPPVPRRRPSSLHGLRAAEPRLGLAMLIGALAGIPGVAYLSALNNLVTGGSSTATQVVAVIIFVLIEFALIIIPFAFLVLRPEVTKALLKHAQDWLLGHARQLIAYTAVILGAYMAISGLVQLI
jgi:hypothetical protein